VGRHRRHHRGVALVGLAHPGETLHHRKALAFAFANAAIIAIYTVVDGLGARSAGNALRYVMVLFVLDGISYPLGVWLRAVRPRGREIVRYCRGRWPAALLGGGASIGSYTIALWAMTRAPVASVAALRETSVLFAALIGTWLLKERFGMQRAVGTGGHRRRRNGAALRLIARVATARRPRDPVTSAHPLHGTPPWRSRRRPAS
jgi:drug/metabolite transporter (DMT)-like permease